MTLTRHLTAAVLAAAVAACTPHPPLSSSEPAPAFDPARFFAGHTEGRGTLRIRMSRARVVIVHGLGSVDEAGVLTLDQTVVAGDTAPTRRRWTFRSVGPGRYTGTLTDAAGPVAGDVTGNRLHLRFHMRGRVVADQWLDLAGDGASAHNAMTFRKFGVVLARLDETIRRVP